MVVPNDNMLRIYLAPHTAVQFGGETRVTAAQSDRVRSSGS